MLAMMQVQQETLAVDNDVNKKQSPSPAGTLAVNDDVDEKQSPSPAGCAGRRRRCRRKRKHKSSTDAIDDERWPSKLAKEDQRGAGCQRGSQR